jgi:hypothetical protein
MVTVRDVTGFEARGITFDGNYPARAGGTGVALQFFNVKNASVRGCRFQNVPGVGVSLTTVSQVWVEGNTFEHTWSSAVRLNTPTTANRRIWIRNNHIVGAQLNGIGGNAAIQSQGGTIQEHIWVENNYVASSGVVGIGLDSVAYGWIRGNRVIGNGSRGEGIAFTGQHIVVSRNTVDGSTAAGILFWAVPGQSSDVEIVDNTCRSSAQGVALVWGKDFVTIQNVEVRGNMLTGNAGFGVQSYKAPGVTHVAWENIRLTDNNLAGNARGPRNFINASSVVALGNTS